MQTATIALHLGGDTGNTIEKYDVTPSEVAVLQVIHGVDAVTDIDPQGDVKRSSRAERERLTQLYGRNTPDGLFSAPAVERLFPGMAARMFEDFDELDLQEELFKPKTRVSPDAKRDPLDHDEDGKKGGSLPAETKSLSAMTKQELLDEAARRGVEVSENEKKADILAAIELDAEAKAVQSDGGDANDGIGDIDDGQGENLFK